MWIYPPLPIVNKIVNKIIALPHEDRVLDTPEGSASLFKTGAAREGGPVISHTNATDAAPSNTEQALARVGNLSFPQRHFGLRPRFFLAAEVAQ